MTNLTHSNPSDSRIKAMLLMEHFPPKLGPASAGLSSVACYAGLSILSRCAQRAFLFRRRETGLARTRAGDLDGAAVDAALVRRASGIGERAELVAGELEGEGADIIAVAPRGLLGFSVECRSFGLRPGGVLSALLDPSERPAPLQAHLLEGVGERQRSRPAENE